MRRWRLPSLNEVYLKQYGWYRIDVLGNKPKFTSAEDFMAAFMLHAEVLQGDMPNYTDIEPVIQISEVLIPA